MSKGRIVFGILIAAAISILGLASAQIDQNCITCHPGMNFAVPDVGITNCSKCHAGLPYGSSHGGGGIYPYDSYGYWKVGTDPTWYLDPVNNSSIHTTAHPGSSLYSSPTPGTLGGYCALRCHLTADCSACHSEVPHISHGSLTSPVLRVCNGTFASINYPQYYEKLVTCANTSCHGQLSKTQNVVLNPACSNCHGVFHVNEAIKHTSDAMPCIDCHNSNISELHIVDVNKGYDCSICHLNPNFDVTTKTANCTVYCHAEPGVTNHYVPPSGHGGPDCVLCHDLGGSATVHVDVGAMNKTDSVHVNLNPKGSAYPDSERCWACHGDGTEPVGHPANYKTPRQCGDCHQNLGASNFSARQVSEHLLAGIDIQTPDAVDCMACHAKSEMLKAYTDPDPGSTIANVSHYGKKRADLIITDTVTYTNCSYCHQNPSTFTSVMADPAWNADIKPHEATNVLMCVNSTCHATGRIHDDSLQMPLFNAGYCANCHGDKKMHNSTVDCLRCHAETSRNIHPIQYVQPDSTFKSFLDSGSTTAANCNDCHYAVVADFPTADPIPELSHSDDNMGQKWGSYWLTVNAACLYCHDSVYHSDKPIGRPLIWNPAYSDYPVTTTGTNCADCHYKHDSYYTTMTDAFSSLAIPPEITGTGGAGYVNHTLRNFTDALCSSCHDGGKNPLTLTPLMHDLYKADAGTSHVSMQTDCSDSGCHDITDVSTLHNACWPCHDTGVTPSTYCSDCHTQQPGDGHGYSATLHNTTDSDSSCFACHLRDLNDEHDKVLDRYPEYTTSCEFCHSGTPTKAELVSPWNKKCEACHPTPHTPTGEHAGIDCSVCHPSNGEPVKTTVYADQVIHITGLSSPTAADISGTDITAEFRDNNLVTSWTIQTDSQSKVVTMKNMSDADNYSKVILSIYIKSSSRNLVEVIVYAYQSDGTSVDTTSYASYNMDRRVGGYGWKDIDVTALAQKMSGYGWMKFRVTVGRDSIEVSEGKFNMTTNGLREETICYQCHDNPFNSTNEVNIKAQFTTGSAKWEGQRSRDYYQKVNTRHDISNADQAYSGAKIECTSCHNAHKATSEYPLKNPDNGAQWTNSMAAFCLRCHDNTWAPGVTGPTTSSIYNISAAYLSDQHGDTAGNRNILFNYTYGNWYLGYPRMNCTDCHDAHGSKGTYHLKPLKDQYGVPQDITNPDAHEVTHWCSACHINPMNQLDSTKTSCISRSCHLHGTSSF